MKELLQRFPSVRCRKSTRTASQCRCKSPSAQGPPRTKYVPKMVSPVRCLSQVSSVQCLVPSQVSGVQCPVPSPSVRCLVPSAQCLVPQPSVRCLVPSALAKCLVFSAPTRCPVYNAPARCLVSSAPARCLVSQPGVHCSLSPYVMGVQFLQLLARQREGGMSGLEKEWVLYCIKYTYSFQFNTLYMWSLYQTPSDTRSFSS